MLTRLQAFLKCVHVFILEDGDATCANSFANVRQVHALIDHEHSSDYALQINFATLEDRDAGLGDKLVCPGEGNVPSSQPLGRLSAVPQHLRQHSGPSHLGPGSRSVSRRRFRECYRRGMKVFYFPVAHGEGIVNGIGFGIGRNRYRMRVTATRLQPSTCTVSWESCRPKETVMRTNGWVSCCQSFRHPLRESFKQKTFVLHCRDKSSKSCLRRTNVNIVGLDSSEDV